MGDVVGDVVVGDALGLRVGTSDGAEIGLCVGEADVAAL